MSRDRKARIAIAHVKDRRPSLETDLELKRGEQVFLEMSELKVWGKKLVWF